MIFRNKKKGLSFDYIILSQSLHRVTAVKDFGVKLTANLNFKDHNSHNVSKAFKICGFIKCVCKTFTNVKVLRSLYIFLVRNQSEGFAVLFGIRDNVHQDKLIKYLCYKSSIQYSTDNFPALCHKFRRPFLQHRRQVADLMFLHKYVHSHLDSTYLVGNIQYRFTSRYLRNYTPFTISFITLYPAEPTSDISIGASTSRYVIKKHLYV